MIDVCCIEFMLYEQTNEEEYGKDCGKCKVKNIYRQKMIDKVRNLNDHINGSVRIKVGDIELLPPKKAIVLKGKAPGRTTFSMERRRTMLQKWMRFALPGAEPLYLEYDKYLEGRDKLSRKRYKGKRAGSNVHVVEMTAYSAPAWYGRALTPIEAAKVDAPWQAYVYPRCTIGRDDYRTQAEDRGKKTQQCGIKMINVKTDDEVDPYKDYYGVIKGIFEIILPHNLGTYVVLEGSWYLNVEADKKSKTFFVTNPAERQDQEPFVSAESIAGQICTIKHPTRENTLVILDCTADFIECEPEVEENEDNDITNDDLEREPVPQPPPIDDANVELGNDNIGDSSGSSGEEGDI